MCLWGSVSVGVLGSWSTLFECFFDITFHGDIKCSFGCDIWDLDDREFPLFGVRFQRALQKGFGGGEGPHCASYSVASSEEGVGCAGGDVAVYAGDEDGAFGNGHVWADVWFSRVCTCPFTFYL